MNDTSPVNALTYLLSQAIIALHALSLVGGYFLQNWHADWYNIFSTRWIWVSVFRSLHLFIPLWPTSSWYSCWMRWNIWFRDQYHTWWGEKNLSKSYMLLLMVFLQIVINTSGDNARLSEIAMKHSDILLSCGFTQASCHYKSSRYSSDYWVCDSAYKLLSYMYTSNTRVLLV